MKPGFGAPGWTTGAAGTYVFVGGGPDPAGGKPRRNGVNALDQILSRYGSGGVETTFKVAGRTYQVFAFPSPGKQGPLVRWNLYAVDETTGRPMRGLSFGMAPGVREAMEEVIEAAREHAGIRSEDTARPASARGFRPSQFD